MSEGLTPREESLQEGLARLSRGSSSVTPRSVAVTPSPPATSDLVGSTVWATPIEATGSSDVGIRFAAEQLSAMNLSDYQLVVLCQTRPSSSSSGLPFLLAVTRDSLAMHTAVGFGAGRIGRFFHRHQGHTVPRMTPHPVTHVKHSVTHNKPRETGWYEMTIDGLGEPLRFDDEAARALYQALTGKPLSDGSSKHDWLTEAHRGRIAPAETTALHTDRAHDRPLRYTTWLALVAGIAAVVAGFAWASTLGATPDWSSWSDRGAALLMAGGAVTILVCGIVVFVFRRRFGNDRLLWPVSFFFGCIALFAVMTIAAVIVELLLDLIGLRDFSWDTLYDFLDDFTATR